MAKKVVIDAGHGGSDSGAIGNGKDVIVISNHINAGGGDGHCVTNL